MTVPISDRLSQLYVGNGTNTRFDFIFRIFQQEDLTGVAVRKKGNTDFETVDPSTYSVTLNADDMGGFVTFNTAPTAGTYFYIAGATPLDQLLDITNYDNFYPDAIERALDKLTALLQEWGTQLDLEKQARILADIHYDSLATEREDRLENRLISYINAVVGITNPKIFDGISDRMVITKDGRTQREFNESIPFWGDDYANFKQETYLREEKILNHVKNEDFRIETSLKSAIDNEKNRALQAEQVLDSKINANGVGNRAYKTYAEMLGDKANIPAESKVTVTNDTNENNNGDWQYDGITFTKSSYDPLNQAKVFTKERIDLRPLIKHEFAVQDKNGFTPIAITKEGVVETPKLKSGGAFIFERNIGPYLLAYSDKNGSIAFGIRKDGGVEIPNLVTGGNQNSLVTSKVLSIVESDTVMHIGDSMTANHYCVQDKSYVSQLSQLSPFRHINYGVTSTDLLEMQSRIINDTTVFSATLKTMKPRYLFIASYVNDRAYADVNIAYFQENTRRLIDVALAHGVQPVLTGYFVLNSTIHQAVKSVADEYQIPVVWSDVLNKQIGFYNGETLFHQWHVGTRTNGLFFLPMLEYIRQQKPMRTLKIFRKRINFTPVSDADLLFKGVVDKCKKWKEITIGHFSLQHEYKYDELDTLAASDYVWKENPDEYAKLALKQEINFSDYALVEMGFDALPQHLQAIEISLKTNGSTQLFVRDNLSPSSELVRGLPTDSNYQAKWNKPRGAWRSVSSANGKVSIGKDQIIRSVIGNKLYLMIKGNFTLSDISVNYSATKYESDLPKLNKPREQLGPEMLVQPLLGDATQLSGWVTSGAVEILVPIDQAKSPRKPDQNIPIDGVVTLTSTNYVQQSISFAVSEEVRTFKVVAWARYFPKAYLDRSIPAYSNYDPTQIIDRSVSGAVAPINKDTFDAEEILLETWVGGAHPDNNGAFQKDFVSLLWRPVTFYIEVQPYETDLSIRLNAASGQVQLAKVSVREVI